MSSLYGSMDPAVWIRPPRTHRGSVTSFTAQVAMTPLHLHTANTC